MKEIVAVQINEIITNDLHDINLAIQSKTISRLFTRTECKNLANFDLGKNWEALATAPTIMKYDEITKNFV